MRSGGRALPVDEALRLLGYDEPRPGQAQAAAAAAAGRDVLLVARPGTGGSSAGLLAGLATPGRTLWVSPPWGPPAGPVPQVEPPAPREAPAQPPTERPPPLARPPGPVEQSAMQAETAEPEFVFATPATAAVVGRTGLVVVDRADELSGDDAGAVARLRGRCPVLLVVTRADATRRAELVDAFGLRAPVHAGGGWDPAATHLGSVVASSAPARMKAVGALVRDGGPAVVVTAGRPAADRTATALTGAGLRAAVWAPPPMRATRAADAVAAWRSRRLDALVVPADELPPLGRARLGLLVDAAGSTPEQWRDRVAALEPARSVLVAEPDGPAAVLAATRGCLRAALLDPYGEPVKVPCGRCDRCRP